MEHKKSTRLLSRFSFEQVAVQERRQDRGCEICQQCMFSRFPRRTEAIAKNATREQIMSSDAEGKPLWMLR